MSQAGDAIPAEGKKAPAFNLPSNSGEKIRLSAFKGSPLVLYFYPKDNTPGCTLEAQDFRDATRDFRRIGVEVLGVSPDDVDSHCKFIDKHGLNFTLLADTDHAVAEKYGVWVEKNMYGRKFWGVQRATFLIDPAGRIAKAWPKVKVKGHAREVLAAAKEI